MKQFSCGAVVPNCQATFEAESEEALFEKIARHAREDHGIDDVTPELVDQIRSHVTEG